MSKIKLEYPGLSANEGNLRIFTYLGRLHGRTTIRMLTDYELDAAHGYILLNCEEVQPFVQ